MSSRRSSGNLVVFIGISARQSAASRPDLAANARSRRMRSVAGLLAVVISQDAAPFLAEDLIERRYQ